MKAIVSITTDRCISTMASVSVFDRQGKLFVTSDLKVKLPAKPHYKEGCKHSCTEDVYIKWREKVKDKVTKALEDSMKESIYGKLDIHLNFPLP